MRQGEQQQQQQQQQQQHNEDKRNVKEEVVEGEQQQHDGESRIKEKNEMRDDSSVGMILTTHENNTRQRSLLEEGKTKRYQGGCDMNSDERMNGWMDGWMDGWIDRKS